MNTKNIILDTIAERFTRNISLLERALSCNSEHRYESVKDVLSILCDDEPGMQAVLVTMLNQQSTIDNLHREINKLTKVNDKTESVSSINTTTKTENILEKMLREVPKEIKSMKAVLDSNGVKDIKSPNTSDLLSDKVTNLPTDKSLCNGLKTALESKSGGLSDSINKYRGKEHKNSTFIPIGKEDFLE